MSGERLDRYAILREQYLSEPWGKLAAAAGFDPINTESAAREAFRFCAEREAALRQRNDQIEVAASEAARALNAIGFPMSEAMWINVGDSAVEAGKHGASREYRRMHKAAVALRMALGEAL
jgi:hypothetical protein